MPSSRERRLEAEVGHDRPHDAALGQKAAGLPVARNDPEHVVAVEDPPGLVGEDGAVRVPIERHAERRSRLARGPGHRRGVKGAAVAIDVAAVGSRVDRRHARARALERAGADLKRRAVAGIHEDREPVEALP